MKKELCKIIQPDNCPTCGSALQKIKDQLFCVDTSCEAQSFKKLEHYAKVLKIKGLGPKSIEKLKIATIQELYGLTEKVLVEALGKNGVKIYSNIQASKSANLAEILHAFSIHLIGSSIALKVSNVVSHIEDFNERKGREAGLGEKTINSLLDWIRKEYFDKGINMLPLNFKAETKKVLDGNGIKVCITGKLQDFSNRTKAGAYLTSKGYTIVSSVTKATDILIDEEGKQSSKRTKAEGLNIDILTIKQLTGELTNE